jgi:hypothetical protein
MLSRKTNDTILPFCQGIYSWDSFKIFLDKIMTKHYDILRVLKIWRKDMGEAATLEFAASHRIEEMGMPTILLHSAIGIATEEGDCHIS